MTSVNNKDMRSDDERLRDAQEAYMNELVPYQLESNDAENGAVFAAINGKMIRFRRDRPVMIKRKYAIALERHKAIARENRRRQSEAEAEFDRATDKFVSGGEFPAEF